MIRLIRGGGRDGSARFAYFAPKTVFDGVDRVLHGSSVQRRGRSHAASVTSEVPKVQKRGNRVPKDQRRVMVVSFVNKYRDSHEGKFPQTSSVHKEIGGSYYVIRDILQELQYKSKISLSTGGKENILSVDLTKESGSSAGCENVSPEGVGRDVETQIHPEAVSVNHSHFVGMESDLRNAETDLVSHASLEKAVHDQKGHKEGSHKLGKDAQRDQSDLVATKSNLLERDGTEEYNSSHEKSWREQKKAKTDNSDFDVTESCPKESEPDGTSHAYLEKRVQDQKECKEGSHEVNEDAKDLLARQANDAEHQQKSTLWGSLKSFADGIVNLWRKKL